MMRRNKARRRTDSGTEDLQYSSVQHVDEDWVMDMTADDTRRARSSVFSDDKPKVAENVKKEWMKEKNLFEEQLENLNSQLFSAFAENQELKTMLEEQKKSSEGQSLRREVDRLKKEKKELQEKMEKERKVHKRAVSPSGSSLPTSRSAVEYRTCHGVNLTTATTGEGFERVSVHSTVPPKQFARMGSWTWARNLLLDFLSDFTDECHTSAEDQTESASTLQAKKLKDNLSRLASVSKPWKELGVRFLDILQWRNLSQSLLVFLIYMYSVWNGWIIQMLLLFAIIRLTLNYLYIIGIAEHFGFQPPKRTLDEAEFASLGISDKYHLVKHVGQMGQNLSGATANHLEKAQNLLLWHHPQSTRKVYSFLWIAFVFSIFLPNSYTITLVGLFIGFKLFIVDNIYRKYPKVKAKYDTVAQMWDSLPTNAELLQRQGLTEEEEMIHRSHSSPSNSETISISSTTSSCDAAFCERFQIPTDEFLIDNWQTGRRCSLLDNDKPLLGSKNGKLYLTQSFLCFEKSSKPGDAADRLPILLSDVTRVAKAKPLSVLPGSGMAIEVHLSSRDKPVMFGAILQRDAVFEDICNQGLILGLPWGSDAEEMGAKPLEQDSTEVAATAEASTGEHIPTETNTD